MILNYPGLAVYLSNYPYHPLVLMPYNLFTVYE